MRSYLNCWTEIDGNPREVKRNGFERVYVSFGVKNDEEELGKGYLQTHSPKCLVPLNSSTFGHVLRAQQQYYARSTSFMSVVHGLMGKKDMNSYDSLSKARSTRVTKVLRMQNYYCVRNPQCCVCRRLILTANRFCFRFYVHSYPSIPVEDPLDAFYAKFITSNMFLIQKHNHQHFWNNSNSPNLSSIIIGQY